MDIEEEGYRVRGERVEIEKGKIVRGEGEGKGG